MAVLSILYAGGYLAQSVGNYAVWQQGGGVSGDGTFPVMSTPDFFTCLTLAFRPPYGVYGVLICAGLFAILLVMIMRLGYSKDGEYDEDRNFTYSTKGTYGASGWINREGMDGALESVPDLRGHSGTILGVLNNKTVCVPKETRLNRNLAVYGASGSVKTRSSCMNRILQSIAYGESLIICDPKSEFYEESSECLRDKGYIARVFNLVSAEDSDSWNCLCETDGQELMARLFVDIIIKNITASGKGDHFWDSVGMNLLKILVLYVDQSYAPENKNIGQVYQLLTLDAESNLNNLFDALPSTHPAKAPLSLFRQASDSVRDGVIVRLGSRLQVFQPKIIKKITAYNEIDLEPPGQRPCAYFCVTSDQDNTFGFLSSLFLSFVFIKLVRFTDKNCGGGRLPVPVHVLGEGLRVCGVIPDLSRKISVIRSRNISMSYVFQNLAGLQNRYPLNQWQEILGDCDIQYFLGCTDKLAAEFISPHTGLASVTVSSKSKRLGTWRISNYTPGYRKTSGVSKRPVPTPDEALRLPVDQALVIIRGKKTLKVNRFDYSKHPEYPKFQSYKASAHIPEWRKLKQEAQDMTKAKPRTPKKTAAREPEEARARTAAKRAASAEPEVTFTADIIVSDRDSILS